MCQLLPGIVFLGTGGCSLFLSRCRVSQAHVHRGPPDGKGVILNVAPTDAGFAAAAGSICKLPSLCVFFFLKLRIVSFNSPPISPPTLMKVCADSFRRLKQQGQCRISIAQDIHTWVRLSSL